MAENDARTQALLRLSPLRSSLAILVLKLLFVITFTALAYSSVFFILNLAFEIPIEWHHHISVGLILLELAKIGLELALTTFVALDWFNRVIIFTAHTMTVRQGTLRVSEIVYDIESIHLKSVNQSVPGKLLGYGNIELIAITGGARHTINLYGIKNPYEIESIFKD